MEHKIKPIEISKFHRILQNMDTELAHFTAQRDAIRIEKMADELDRMLCARDRESALRSLESATAKLREVRSALDRIQNGTYGICEECEEPISVKRLIALPSAALCIRCQEASD